MNNHFHPYSRELSSSPPDNASYGNPSNGHIMPHQGNRHPSFQTQQPHHNHPLHHHHHHHLHNMNNNNNSNSNNQNCATTKVCCGCGSKINERFLLYAADGYWHNNCLKCSCCGAMLADIGSSCFQKAGMFLCKTDYARLFGNSGACSACGQTIPAGEVGMKLPSVGTAQSHHWFHMKCFACSKCSSPLMQGDRYYLLSGSLVCEQDWQKLIKNSQTVAAVTTGTGVRKGKVGRPRRTRE